MNVHSWRLAFVCLIGSGCTGSIDAQGVAQVRPLTPDASTFPATFARQWMTNLANSVKGDGISPPVAARIYAYAAIGMYESVVHGMPGYQSLGGQLNGLAPLPQPQAGHDYDWPTVLAQTMSRMAMGGVYVFPNRVFFEHTTMTQASLMFLGPTQIGFRLADGVSQSVSDDSIAYGNALADALIPWTFGDGYYAIRYLGFTPPTGPDKWVPTGFSDNDKVSNPLEPSFGSVRTLAVTNSSECAVAGPPPFSTLPTSAFYQAAVEVNDVVVNLTDEQSTIARYWADGPGDTATPAGHWVAIASQLIGDQALDLGRASQVYALLSIGFLDSFVSIWQSKYTYNLLRPTTYIRRNGINPTFTTFLPTPQFPSYVSGHSGQSGASARLLTALFGDISFTDRTKTRRGFAQRSFAHFDDAANEAALSRLYGGIHYRFDNDDGLTMGRCVADKVIARVHMLAP